VSNSLGTSRTLALLDQLKAAAQEFASGKRSLDQEFEARTTAENRGYNRSQNEGQQRLGDVLVQAESQAQEVRTTFQARSEKRRGRINDAHKRLRRKAVDDVTAYEGARKQKLQTGAMEAERKRDADLKAALESNAEFKQRLADSEHRFAEIERASLKVFRGAGGFRGLMSAGRPVSEPDTGPGEAELFKNIDGIRARAGQRLSQNRKRIVPAIFRFMPIWLLLLLVIVVAAVAPMIAAHAGKSMSPQQAIIIGSLAAFVFIALFIVSRAQTTADGKSMAEDLLKARRLHEVCYQKSDATLQAEQNRIRNQYKETSASIDVQYRELIKEAIDLRDLRPRQLDEKAREVFQRYDRVSRFHSKGIEAGIAGTVARIRADAAGAEQSLTQDHAARLKKFSDDHAAGLKELEHSWATNAAPVLNEFKSFNAQAGTLFPPWESSDWQKWSPPLAFQNAAKFGELDIDMEKFTGVQLVEKGLPSRLSVPLALGFPNEGSILFETGINGNGSDQAIASINDIIFRLLSTTPPGKLSLTIFDPIGLGQNFAGIMHLADYDESHLTSRIWTQTAQMEEKLAELNEHMEKVIQMYLRNEYQTIAEYNAQAGAIAEKYHFLVVASFPAQFSDTAARRLRNIAASGARCGVYTLIHWDQRQPAPQDFVPDELRNNSVRLVCKSNAFEFAEHPMPGTAIQLEPPPSPEFATGFLHKVGELGRNANRVEVPFADIAPDEKEIWSESTTEELRVPIGRSGATKLQYLAIGKGTRQHALIAGKTGSGKSTLFHVIITNLALWSGPDEVEFYLVDFKKGVEFKCYGNRRLPHARVVAIESDRAFGLSVLERVDAELRRRGDLFRKLGVQDIPGYKRAGGKEKMPRSLLMIDEFQEFFTEEDRISQAAAVLLDRIVRQGRAFGIHVILGSQTLGGAYTLARATLGQMVIRIALQCNEADAYLIMDQDNPAPRLLSRPGEGIYNDAAGAIEGNSPFQAVWIPEDVRDEALAKIRERTDAKGGDYPGPFVFEGNAPAEIRENLVLQSTVASEPPAILDAVRTWLGAPNSIKGPTEVAFRPQGGNNLMIVGQNEESTLAMLSVTLIGLSAQMTAGQGRIILVDSTVPGSPQAQFLEQVISILPREIVRPKGAAGISELMASLAEELKQRSGGADEVAVNGASTGRIFLIIHGLENFKKLRQEDDFAFSSGESSSAPNPAAVLQSLVAEGAAHGIHVIVTCDSFNNISRFLGRKALTEFSNRVLFQMSASDSAALIDAPDAGNLGLHRALLYNDREGYTEVFRPYARPGNEWLDQVAAQLKRPGVVAARVF
jgi:ABC-type multidrug transport system fused ATPase/permease subunit